MSIFQIYNFSFVLWVRLAYSKSQRKMDLDFVPEFCKCWKCLGLLQLSAIEIFCFLYVSVINRPIFFLKYFIFLSALKFWTKSIEWFIEDQSFSPSYFSVFMCRRSSLCLIGSGRGAKSHGGEKAWSSINHSVPALSGLVLTCKVGSGSGSG